MMPDTETPLRLARHHVANGSRLVDEQAVRVARMDPHGDQVGLAIVLLETMKQTLAVFVADLARLEAKSS